MHSCTGCTGITLLVVWVAFLQLTPYLHFSFSFLIFSWAGIFHYALGSVGSNPFLRLRVPFVVLNIVVSVGVISLFVMIGIASGGMLYELALIGSYLVGALSALIAFGYYSNVY